MGRRPKGLVGTTWTSDHSFRKIQLAELGDLLVFFWLDVMGIQPLEVGMDAVLSERGEENGVALVDWPFAWR